MFEDKVIGFSKTETQIEFITWKDSSKKPLQRISLDREGKFFVAVGINPSKADGTRLDNTNVNLINILSEDLWRDYKGYYLTNFSPIMKTDGFKNNEINEMDVSFMVSILNEAFSNKLRVVLFYGRNSKTKYSKAFTKDFCCILEKLSTSDNLFITYDKNNNFAHGRAIKGVMKYNDSYRDQIGIPPTTSCYTDDGTVQGGN